VELGYGSEEVARHEAARCLECGCTALFTCDLKKWSTEYQAEQNGLGGEFKEFGVDYRHPYVEIDNNKCILCSRCIRICREVVGADALGLVNRGFETYVAPAMGKPLQETACESCGMCISTCPTGAIAENVPFKPGPVKLEPAETICNYCSIGCTITLDHRSQFVMHVSGKPGLVNTDGNLCRYPKFGYHYLNDKERVTRPLMKINGRFEEVSYEQAFQTIKERMEAVEPDENVFFAGARLTNEEQYLVQKLARAGAGTNNVTSFHYLDRGDGYRGNATANVPFDQLGKASKIYLVGSEINMDNAVLGFTIYNLQFTKGIPVELVTTKRRSSMEHKVNSVLRIKSYYHFIKAVNHYLVSNNMHNALFINDNCEGFEAYREELMKENFGELVEKAGALRMEDIIDLATGYNEEMNAVVVFSEKEISSHASRELFHLAMITGKLGKTASGVIALKEKNNSQGLFDMGVSMAYGVGGVPVTDRKLVEKMKKAWKVKELPEKVHTDIYDYLEEGCLKNLFIFGEDPLGCSEHKAQVEGWLNAAGFVVVQDYFMTDTASHADVILPASLPVESGGSFTNTRKVIQPFEKHFEPVVEKTSLEQLADLLRAKGVEQGDDEPGTVLEEANSLFIAQDREKYEFSYTVEDDENRLFRNGCDHVVKRFDEEFVQAFENAKTLAYEGI
jgi:formate dehydrogenase major subunit